MDPEAPKPLKTLNIVVNCLFVLFILVSAYLDFFVKLKSVYWKISQFGALLILFITTIVLRRVRNKEGWGQIIAFTVIWLIWLSMMGSREITKYKNNRCQDKFGMEFNQPRRSLGIPVIPADWHIDLRDDRSTDWKKKDTSGHYWKNTFVDSLCTLQSEDDYYNFKPIKGMSRSLSIYTTFARGKGGDITRFDYEAGKTEAANQTSGQLPVHHRGNI